MRDRLRLLGSAVGREFRELGRYVRPVWGYGVICGLLMTIIPTLKFLTGPAQDPHLWAARLSPEYAGLLEYGLYASFVLPPLFAGFLGARRAGWIRPGWLAAGLSGIVAALPWTVIMGQDRWQQSVSLGEPLWLAVELAVTQLIGVPLGIGLYSAVSSILGASLWALWRGFVTWWALRRAP
jgi:hypothetical protein